MVLNQHRVNNPNLPPTTMIMGKENQNKTQTSSIRAPSNSSQKRSQLPNTIQQNINKSLIKAPTETQPSSSYKELSEFLDSIGLQKYYQTFLDNGVEDLEIILELDDKHLEQMKVPLGHKLKIMKRIKDLRKEKGMTVPESRQGARQTSNAEVETTSKPYVNKREDLEELPDPTGGKHF